MADLVITSANVVPVAGYTAGLGIAAGTITAGQVVYKRASDGKYTPADNTTQATAGISAPGFGIALNSASAGQPVQVMTAGTITIGATTVQGTIYILSATGTSGKIAPASDFSGYASGDLLVELGAAPNATQITLNFQNYGGAIVHA